MSFVSKGSQFLTTSSPIYIIGASNNPEKFGYKVIQWYLEHDYLPNTSSKSNGKGKIIPIHPSETQINCFDRVRGVQVSIPCLKDIQYPSSINNTGVSLKLAAAHFISPPGVTESFCRKWVLNASGADGRISRVWFQPGSISDAFAIEMEKNLSTGNDNSIFLYGGGVCVLRDGDFMLSRTNTNVKL